MDYTVVLIKPDGVRRGIVGEIITRFERVGLKIIASKMVWVDKSHVGKHYADDKKYLTNVGEKTLENYKKYGMDPKESLGTKDPYKIGLKVRGWNMDFLTAGPVFAFILEGEGAAVLVRKMVGSLFPYDSPPGTIRGDYSFDSFLNANLNNRSAQNIIHASGSQEEAEFERKLWFKEKEIYDY